MSWVVACLALLTIGGLGLLMLLMIGLISGPAGLFVGMILGMLPVPFWVLLALWLDRYEAEPPWMLAAVFFWGAAVAVFFSFIFNTLNQVLAQLAFGAQAAGVIGAVLSAPFVEEIFKGLALLILFVWKKHEFDGILDGIVYATMVGLGFAMTENFLYYGRALQEGGFGGALFTFVLRGIISPLSHPLFTSMTGIGLGWARQSDRPAVKILAPPVGLGLAMFLHFVWNGSASLGAAFLLAYVMLMVPALITVLTIVHYSLRHEGAVVRENLAPDLRNGLLTDAELATLSSASARTRAAWNAYTTGGLGAWKAQNRFHQMASEVAFHRRRIARGHAERDEDAAELEAEYVRHLHARRGA